MKIRFEKVLIQPVLTEINYVFITKPRSEISLHLRQDYQELLRIE